MQYDAEGKMIGWTQAESEWDDSERAKMEALAIYDSRVCACGFHESTADEDPDLDLDFRVCPVCAGTAQLMRIQHAADNKAKGERPDPSQPWPEDGRHVRLTRTVPPQGADVAENSLIQ